MRKLLHAAAIAAALALSYPSWASPPFVFSPAVTKSVTTSATAIASVKAHALIQVWNNDASKTLYVAFDSSLTTASGIPVLAGQWIEFSELAPGQILYGVTTSGTLDARVQEAFQQ